MDKYYKVLGLDRNAPFSDVKASYRNLSMKYHPDLNGDTEDNKKKFYEITNSYNEIKKELKKICKLLSLDDNECHEVVELEYKKQLEEYEFRDKMGNMEAKHQLKELKDAYKSFATAFKTKEASW